MDFEPTGVQPEEWENTRAHLSAKCAQRRPVPICLSCLKALTHVNGSHMYSIGKDVHNRFKPILMQELKQRQPKGD